MTGTTPDEAPPFQVVRSEDVLADVIHLRQDHPKWSGQQTAHVRNLIAGPFEVGRVTDFVVDGSYYGADPDDAHVHAAALAC